VSERAARSMKIEMTFRDVEGATWHRGSNGILQLKAA
jgi:hypothetical protein